MRTGLCIIAGGCVSGLCPLNARSESLSPVVTTRNVPRYCQVSPGMGTDSFLVEKLWARGSRSSVISQFQVKSPVPSYQFFKSQRLGKTGTLLAGVYARSSREVPVLGPGQQLLGVFLRLFFPPFGLGMFLADRGAGQALGLV